MVYKLKVGDKLEDKLRILTIEAVGKYPPHPEGGYIVSRKNLAGGPWPYPRDSGGLPDGTRFYKKGILENLLTLGYTLISTQGVAEWVAQYEELM